MHKWQKRFLRLANEAAIWSKDPDCKVGVCLVSPDRREFAFGYNGFPTGIVTSYHDRESKNKLTVHAEVNAILNARRNLSGWTCYSTKAPCLDCAKALIQAGIAEVVCPEPATDSNWYRENISAISLLIEAQIYINLVRDGTLISIEAHYKGLENKLHNGSNRSS